MWLLQEGVQQESETENPHDTSYRGEAVQVQSRLRKRIPKPRPTRRSRADASRRERVPVHSLPEDVHEDIKPESSCEEARREEGASVRWVWKSFRGAGRSSKLQTQWEKLKKKLQRFAMEILIRSWPQQNTTLVVYNWTIGNRGIGKKCKCAALWFWFSTRTWPRLFITDQRSAVGLGMRWRSMEITWKIEFNVKNQFKIQKIVIFTKCELFVGLEPWSGRLTKRTIPGQRFSMFSIVLSSCMRPKCCQLNAWQRSEQFYTRDKLTQTSWIINFVRLSWWGVHGTSIDKLIYWYTYTGNDTDWLEDWVHDTDTG